MNKIYKVKLTESDLRNIISESVNTILNEIGDTRRGQYLLGKLYQQKNDKAYDDFKQSGDLDKLLNNHDAQDIKNYANKHNTKGMDGEWAFKSGKYGKVIGKGFPRNQKPQDEQELWDYYTNKDKTEKKLSPEQIYNFSLQWLEQNSSKILRYKGNKYTQKILSNEGCRNLGEYILKCSRRHTVPGHLFYFIFMEQAYKDMGIYFEPSMRLDNSERFHEAWDDFCYDYSEIF